MNQAYSIFTLPNSLRMVCRHTSGPVSYIGVAVNAGSRDEDSDHHGPAHFVEHTIFKGTAGRRSWQIASRMEEVGARSTPTPQKEETMVYTNAPAGFEERAIEPLADLVGAAASRKMKSTGSARWSQRKSTAISTALPTRCMMNLKSLPTPTRPCPQHTRLA